jgi:hypothetical protein
VTLFVVRTPALLATTQRLVALTQENTIALVAVQVIGAETDGRTMPFVTVTVIKRTGRTHYAI